MKTGPTIDAAKCTVCGLCFADCPRGVLVEENGAVNTTGGECMLCAHCLCICPVAAVSFDRSLVREVAFSTLKSAGKSLGSGAIEPGRFSDIVRSRRSVRQYTDAPVADAELRDLIEFAATAPSGTNARCWEFTVVRGKAAVQDLAERVAAFYRTLNRFADSRIVRTVSGPFTKGKLSKYHRDRKWRVEQMLAARAAGKDMFFWDAPAVIVVHSGRGTSTPAEDAQFAAYNITLLAHTMGLGTCFIGYAREAMNRGGGIKRHLGIPGGNTVHAVLVVGRPAVKYARLPPIKDYKVDLV
jgi:nitroreductase/Pyruvate/2-oxoacid:ferredoxin oxidoreductase delta subunit